MDPQQQQHGVQVGHLLQVQEALTRSISEAIDRHARAIESRVTELVDSQRALAEYQRVANGRMSKLEAAHARLRTRIDRSSSVFASMSKTQKAKLAAAIAVIVPVGVEALHRLIPVALAFLVRATGLPVPLPADPPPPVVQPAPTAAPTK
jgi:hypothetical protein